MKDAPLMRKKAGQAGGTQPRRVLTWNRAAHRRRDRQADRQTGQVHRGGEPEERAGRLTPPIVVFPWWLQAFLTLHLCAFVSERDFFMKVKRQRRKHDRARKEADSGRGGCSLCLCRWVVLPLLLTKWLIKWSVSRVVRNFCVFFSLFFPLLNHKHVSKMISNIGFVGKFALWRVGLPNTHTQRRDLWIYHR